MQADQKEANQKAAGVVRLCDTIAQQFQGLSDQGGFARDLNGLTTDTLQRVYGKGQIPQRFQDLATTWLFQQVPDQIRQPWTVLHTLGAGALGTAQITTYEDRTIEVSDAIGQLHQKLLGLITRHGMKADERARAGATSGGEDYRTR